MSAISDGVLAASRPMGVAREIGAQEVAAPVVFAKRVILTGERDALATANGRWCLIDAFRLLVRVVGNLEIALPDGVPHSLLSEIQDLVRTTWSQGAVRQVNLERCNWTGAAAILNIGFAARTDIPWTSVIANGWVARCTSGSTALPVGCAQDNPISCMLAASFGVSEVFKRVYRVPREIAPPIEDESFSLFELTDQFDGVGPDLPISFSLPSTLLLGAGAIGNGLVLLGAQLPLTGDVLVMDKQTFGEENFGTCTLLDDQGWVGESKAEMLASWLKAHSRFNVTGLNSRIENAQDMNLLVGRNIDLVINGLDDIQARKSAQKLWPRLIVDGAINSAGAAVVTHSFAHRECACLRCAFDSPLVDHLTAQSEATGLSIGSLKGDQNRLITDKDIDDAAEEARPFLKTQQKLGRTICSTMEDALAAGLGLTLKAGFRPSVPFVATAAASLVWAQVLRNLQWPEERFVHTLQIASLFLGAHTARSFKRLASSDCECARHADIIDTILSSRSAAPDLA
jgi:hypothetical protein